MLYIVVERFKPDAAVEIYRRAEREGRLLPDGLNYIASWVDPEFRICFQLMQTENEGLFLQWTSRWNDLVDFEIVPVRTSAEAFQIIAPRL
jgi:hypothetical protein